MRIASFLALLSLLAGPTVVDSTLVNVTVQVDSSVGVISPYMNSLSLVYCWARDAIYRNGTVAAWAKHNRVATARWPAGTASYFDWRVSVPFCTRHDGAMQNSTGEMGRSTDDPSWKGPPAPTQDWMDLDEYLTLCEQVGMRPLIGANYNDHGHLWANLSFSVRRVTEQAQRVISRGHAGAFWYVGNEDGVMSNVDRWIQHAQAIKSEDPSAVIFFNDNHLAPDQLTSFLHKAGNLVGGAEFHGKWPHGGKCKGAPASVADWQQQVPLIDIKTNKTWRKRFAELRAAANAAGRSDLLLANNEFGLGKPCSLGDGFDRYTKSLVNIEFAMEMRLSGADVAAFWDNSDGGMAGEGPTSIAEHMLMDSSEGYRFNPVHFGLEWLATAGEAEAVEMTTSARQLHGFAALSKTPEVDGDVQVFLLNKYPTARPVEVCVEGGHGVVAGNASTLTDGDDHWGTTIHNTLSCNNGCCSHHMPPLTFSRLVLTTGDDGQPR